MAVHYAKSESGRISNEKQVPTGRILLFFLCNISAALFLLKIARSFFFF